MIIVGASPLFGSLKTFKPKARARLTIDTTAIIPGLNIQAKTTTTEEVGFLLFQQRKTQGREVCDLAQRRQQFPLAPQEQLLPDLPER